MNIYLKKASEDDLDVILDILNQGTRNKIRRGDLAWGMSEHSPEAIRVMIVNESFYLALTDTMPVGVFALTWQDEHTWGKQPVDAGYVQRFAVAAGHSGQNIGGQILDLALREVEQHGCQYLRIAVPSGNLKLRAYYENHGFVRADYKVVAPVHPAYPAAYYERLTAHNQAETSLMPKRNFFLRLFHK